MRAAACALLAVTLSAGPAAAGEDDRSISASLGYATFSVPDHTPHGGSLDVAYERGFADALSFRAEVGGGAYPIGTGSPGYSLQAAVGLTYLFDVVRYVPYIHAGVGGILLTAPDLDPDLSPLVELGIGLDILHSRTWSYGAAARFESFVNDTAFFTAGVRLSYRWGFF
ncbi:MAG TPA: hypothetical protein VL172_01745 [Kofleriaceae bacterium]|nr:hypothetical protein [Kofleriaceae bacterium]